MTNFRRLIPESLRHRMLLIFFVLLLITVAVTLFTVLSATFKHSTRQVNAHALTSVNVVKDKVNTRANGLSSAINDLVRDATFRRIVLTETDVPTLKSALENYQRRYLADLSWIVWADGKTVSSTSNIPDEQLAVTPEDFQSNSITWFKGQTDYYLVRSAPVRETLRSPRVRGWLLMGISASKLINQELVELTDMQISLMLPGAEPKLLGSSFPQDKHNSLISSQFELEPGLHSMTLGDQNQLYVAEPMGKWQSESMFVLLATVENAAYLSYNTLLGQLIVILGIVGAIALIAALYFSSTITSPVIALAEAAKKIRQGEYVRGFPSSSTREVRTLTESISDMQEGIRQREKDIHRLAYFDELTGLPNRTQFGQQLNRLIESGEENELAILFLDIDRFQDINDTLGHDVGDCLLKEISQRLTVQSAHAPFIARLGGDEFGLIFTDISSDSIAQTPKEIAAIFNHPFELNQISLDVDVSVGMAIFPEHADNAQGLLLCADIATYSCKGHHSRFATYQPALNNYSVLRLNLMTELRSALAEGQLTLYYQPKLAIEENRITSVECLIRWIHPTHGFIPPDEFIPLAEQTGAIRDVTNWAVNTALKQHKVWVDQGIDLGIAINISAHDLVDMKLPAYVKNRLEKYQTPAPLLTLEVTESAVMNDPENALNALNKLREMGITLSIDDFGTGYSSMAQLNKMPVSELKIDKAFVFGMVKNERDKVIVKTMIGLASNLNMSTVAEGVEDADTLELLSELGCSKAQGYYLSKPLPPAEFTQWIKNYQA